MVKKDLSEDVKLSIGFDGKPTLVKVKVKSEDPLWVCPKCSNAKRKL